MNQFETELIRVIEHGCPYCGYEFFTLYRWQKQRVSAAVYHYSDDDIYLDLDWDEDVIGDTKPDEVECKQCGDSLWTSDGGWIPELAEIVKGE